jgi:hydrogenase maturation protease
MATPAADSIGTTGLEPVCPAADSPPPPVCLIAGLGNCLVGDDGIGVHAVRELQANPPAGAHLLEVGTDVFSAIPWLESAPRVLAIDAMDAGGPPGTLYRCPGRDMSAAPARTSLHELGLLAVLEFIPPERRPEITVLGVQPASLEIGLELSPPVRAALPRVIKAARVIVEGWRTDQRARRDSADCGLNQTVASFRTSISTPG